MYVSVPLKEEEQFRATTIKNGSWYLLEALFKVSEVDPGLKVDREELGDIRRMSQRQYASWRKRSRLAHSYSATGTDWKTHLQLS